VTTWERTERFLGADVWTLDPARLRPAARMGLRTLRLLLAVGDELRRGDLQLRATALVYTTLLSLVPFLAVAFSVLKAFDVHQHLLPVLTTAFQGLGPAAAERAETLVALVDRLEVGALGMAGVAGLFYTAISLIAKIEEALNHVWHVRRARSYGRRFADYLSVVLVGPVLVLTALAIIASARSNRAVTWLAGTPVGALVDGVSGHVLPILILAVAFAFLYRFLPYTRVRLAPAAIGGVTAAVLWTLAGVAFTTFVAASPKYAAIYSGFAILILFLVWLDLAWLITLVGNQIAYFVQHPPAHPTRAGRAGLTGLARERLALGVVAEVTRRHLEGERPAPPAELARRLGAPAGPISGLVDVLALAGILVRTTDPDGVTLARSADTVLVADVLEVIRDGRGAGPALGDPERGRNGLAAVLACRDQGARQALAGLTARQLAERPSRRLDDPTP
jgi:membrane protein